MELNDSMAREIAEQLGLRAGDNGDREIIKRLDSKSDAELEREILKIKEQLKANDLTYEKQINMLKGLVPMVNDKQREKLQRVIELLK